MRKSQRPLLIAALAAFIACLLAAAPAEAAGKRSGPAASAWDSRSTLRSQGITARRGDALPCPACVTTPTRR